VLDYNLQDYDAALSFVKLTMEAGKKKQACSMHSLDSGNMQPRQEFGEYMGKGGEC